VTGTRDSDGGLAVVALLCVIAKAVAALAKPMTGHEQAVHDQIERARWLGFGLFGATVLVTLGLLVLARRRHTNAATIRPLRGRWPVLACVILHPGWWWPTGGDHGTSRLVLSIGFTILATLVAGLVVAGRAIASSPPRFAHFAGAACRFEPTSTATGMSSTCTWIVSPWFSCSSTSRRRSVTSS
jgi:hypothetical protein